MFEVLMFLFENYIDESALLNQDEASITTELEQVGFARQEIEWALNWLQGLSDIHEAVAAGPSLTSHSIRHYTIEEAERLGTKGIGLLLYLEQLNILDPLSREIVIDRIMALDYTEVDLARIRWVVLMVLFTQPEKKSALTLLQAMILADAFKVLH